MKSGFREFLRDSVKDLQGEQGEFKNHAFKHEARKLLNKDHKERKAKRKAAKQARKRSK